MQVPENVDRRAEGREDHILGRARLRPLPASGAPSSRGGPGRGRESPSRMPLPSAVIAMPSTYLGLVRGLCGNYDKNKRNDFMLPNGSFTQNLLVFGNSWEVKAKEGHPRFSR